MERDQEILRVFEITDDTLQGIWAYFAFSAATYHAASDQKVGDLLPETHPMTQDWDRVYDRIRLVTVMRKVYPRYHARTCLVAIAGAFEVALVGFRNRLKKCRVSQSKAGKPDYKSRLEWAFGRLITTSYGTPEMISRLDENCRKVDHARRLRNCILHNNGLFNTRYETDAIRVKDKVNLHPDYAKLKANHAMKVPIVLTAFEFDNLYKAHVELLHQLHDVLQREDFGYMGKGYNYADENKMIQWERILTGA
jgi:hypothetical protein